MQNMDVTIAVVIFLVTYAFIISEKLHRAVVSLAGAMLVVFLGIIEQEEAIAGIDFNTLALMLGMMMIVIITRRSGVFEYMAIKSAKIARGDPIRIMVLFTTITGVLSAFLGSVTVVLLMVPVTISICDRLNITPLPYLLCEIIGSNIGGTATPVGDPPNMLIYSASDLQFMDFVFNLTPLVFGVLAVTIALVAFYYRNRLTVSDADKAKVMQMNELRAIKDWALLKKSLLVLAMTITGFFLQQVLGLHTGTIALAGAMLLMIISGEELEGILLSVEWPTLFFFIGLFILVESLVKVGIIGFLARESLALTHGDFPLTVLLILWMSGIFSAFVDNIPFVTAMIPLIKEITLLTGMPIDPLWWSLALGTCLGGNGTLIGASANVVVAGVSEKHGVLISFMWYLKIAFPLMIVSLLISTLYLYLRYLI